MSESYSFTNFFEELHGCKPFPWQDRLANEISEKRNMPDILNLPTASGKTALIDIWLWSLYKNISSENKRDIPIRLFYVVNRRLIADAAHKRAEHIAAKLRESRNGVLRKMADGLQTFSGNDSPLETAILRGGMARESNWCKSPAQPMVCSGTVDMIGSRLLFRGYGIPLRQRSIDAGLTGCDAMVVLDEVHLSEAFESTLKNIANLRGDESETEKLRVVRMSATNRNGKEKAFELNESDFKNKDILRRHGNPKSVRLEQTKSGKTSDLIDKLAEQAELALKSSEIKTPVVAVVVNTVEVAREIHNLLTNKKDGTEAVLLTGRCRPFEREEMIEEYGQRLFAQEKRDGETPLFVIATQCVEVGADFDFDAMVSEIAPLDSLIQRFGRLNRLGRRKEAEGVVVAPKSFGERKKQIPFYGDAPEKTWKRLKRIAKKDKVDFCVSAIKKENLQDDDCIVPRKNAPVIAPEYVDIWSRTSVGQFAESDISLFLHGESEPADVQVVWRGDIPEDLDGEVPPSALQVLSGLPPQAGESVSLPVWKFRNWITGGGKDESLADVEGSGKEAKSGQGTKAGKIIRWRGYEKDEKDRAKLVSPQEIKSGDVVVLSSARGGCDEFGWNPQYEKSVKDIAKKRRKARKNYREYALRVHPNCCDCDKSWKDVKEWIGDEGLPVSRKIAEKLFGIKNPENCKVVLYGKTWEKGFALLIRENKEQKRSRGGKFVSLKKHCEGVAAMAEDFAKKAGLSKEFAAVMKTAGEWHDAGKAESRWQEYIRGGENSDEPVAKSPLPVDPKAWGKSGLSKGERHEYWSCLLAEKKLPEENRDLILHLIASHHGNARPFPMPPEDGGELARASDKQQIEFNGASAKVADSLGLWKLDSGFASRFAELNKQYGYWGLAYLEAIFRLADYEQSRREETE